MFSLLSLKNAQQKRQLSVEQIISAIYHELTTLGFGDTLKVRQYSPYCIGVVGYVEKTRDQFEIEIRKSVDYTYVTFFTYFYPDTTRFTLTIPADVNNATLKQELSDLYAHIPSYVCRRLDYVAV